MNPLSIYFIFNIFLMIMSGYIFIKATPDLMKQREYTIFKVFIISFIVYVIVNSLWTMQEYDIISLPKFLFTFICFCSLLSVSFCCLCFYKFTMIYYGYSNKKNTLYEFFGALPFLVTALLLFVSIWTKWVFYVSDDLNIIHGPLYVVLMISAGIYFGIILVSSVLEMMKSKTPQARKNCFTLFLLVIFLVSWIILDNIFQSLTIIPIAVFGVILVIFTTFQQSSINTDALTQMNNRRKAMEYLSIQLNSVSIDSPLYLYICDINAFKSINDNYGHLEGDNALIILADAIKEVIGNNHGFAARYGGDEFIIAIRNQKEGTELIKKIDDVVKAKCILLKKPYEVSISYGYAVCTDRTMVIENYLKEADMMLYKNKNKIN